MADEKTKPEIEAELGGLAEVCCDVFANRRRDEIEGRTNQFCDRRIVADGGSCFRPWIRIAGRRR